MPELRPVSCKCGWRGTQGNWDRHIDNARHQRWVKNNYERQILQNQNLNHELNTVIEEM